MWLVVIIGILLAALAVGLIWTLSLLDREEDEPLPRAQIYDAYRFYFGFLLWFFGRLLGRPTKWRK
jgi:hypothetical protein